LSNNQWKWRPKKKNRIAKKLARDCGESVCMYEVRTKVPREGMRRGKEIVYTNEKRE
jgi:hypothetical protein